MKKIELKSYAKINLSIDILGKYENGYHQVEMVMQHINLFDLISIKWFENEPADSFEISIKTDKFYLPTDNRNLAYKAAEIMYEKYGQGRKGTVRIDMKKNIPVAAGLAGGSGNGAAVIHGLNVLWDLNRDLEELCQVSSALGSDVPFTLMGQAKTNKCLGEEMNNHRLAVTCALAEGTGTELTPLPALNSRILLSKPSISVSTAEVYKGMKLDELEVRPDNKKLIDGLKNADISMVTENMANVLEQYTLANYDVVQKTKDKIKEVCPEGFVLMSGSGPSVFAIVSSDKELEEGYEVMKNINKETYKTRTLI